MKVMDNMRFKILMYIILCGLLLIVGCGEKVEGKLDTIKEVKVQKVKFQSVDMSGKYSGIIKPENVIKISSKISGKIKKVNIDVGMEVKKGDVILTFEDNVLREEYNRACNSYNIAKENLIKVSDLGLSAEIIDAGERIEQAQKRYDEAKSYFNNIKDKYDTQKAQNAGNEEIVNDENVEIPGLSITISKLELDSAELKVKSAELQLNAAKEYMNKLKEKTNTQVIDSASIAVEKAAKAKKIAEAKWNSTIIKAPFAGIITRSSISEGIFISKGTELITMYEKDKFIAKINVPDYIATGIKEGQNADIQIKETDKEEYKGVVKSIIASRNHVTNVYSVEINVKNDNKDIKKNMYATVKILKEDGNDVLAVPNECIIKKNDKTYIYVAKGNKAKIVDVKIGVSNDTITEIKSGIKENDLVIFEGQNSINDGDLIEYRVE